MIAFLATLFTVVNAPFTVALLVVALYVGLQVVGLLPWGEYGAEGDAGADHELAAEAGAGGSAEAGLDAEADAGGDVDADAAGAGGHPAEGDADGATESDHQADHAASPGGLSALLGVLGVGRVPLAIVWQTFFTMFGLTGITATTLAMPLFGAPSSWFLAFSLPLATLLGAVLCASAARGIARLIPSSSGEATRKRDLVGCSGVVISTKVDAQFGEVRLRDPEGRTLRLICHTLPGEPQLPEGTEVVVVEYERVQGHLFVSRLAALPEGRKCR